jgi:hypothetical protein
VDSTIKAASLLAAGQTQSASNLRKFIGFYEECAMTLKLTTEVAISANKSHCGFRRSLYADRHGANSS